MAWLALRLRESGKAALPASPAEVKQLKAENARLEAALADTERFFNWVPSMLIGLDPAGCITRWNPAAAHTLGLDAGCGTGRTLDECGVERLHATLRKKFIRWLECATPSYRCPDIPYRKNGKTRLRGLEIHRAGPFDGNAGYVITSTDLTDPISLGQGLQQAQRLETVGQLAAGIAHEINTPIQSVGDNLRFLRDASEGERPVPAAYETLRRTAEQQAVTPAALENLARVIEGADPDYLLQEIRKPLSNPWKAWSGCRRLEPP